MSKKDVLVLSDFKLGLNTRLDPTLIDPRHVSDCQDVLFDEDDPATRRNGFTMFANNPIIKYNKGTVTYSDLNFQTTFSVTYDGDVLPASAVPPWAGAQGGTTTFLSQTPGVADSGRSVFQIQMTAGGLGSDLTFSRTGDAAPNATGNSLEATLRMATAANNGRMDLMIFDGTQRARLRITNTGLQLTDDATSSAVVAIDSVSLYHTYRLSLQGTTARAYVDGLLQITFTVANPTVTNQFFFRTEVFPAVSIDARWDRVRYGAITSTSTVPTLIGTGTAWSSEVAAGDLVRIPAFGLVFPGSLWQKVTAVISNTEIQIERDPNEDVANEEKVPIVGAPYIIVEKAIQGIFEYVKQSGVQQLVVHTGKRLYFVETPEQLPVGVMEWRIMGYSAGTVSITNGSAVVTGAGTAWGVSNAAAGDLFYVKGDQGTAAQLGGNGLYRILSVDSPTQITLQTTYAGTTAAGKTYYILKELNDANAVEADTANDFLYLVNGLDYNATRGIVLKWDGLSLVGINPAGLGGAKPKLVKVHKDKLVFGNSDTNPSTIYLSEPTDWENITTIFEVGGKDGGFVTALAPFLGDLVVFKSTSMWKLLGDDKNNFVLVQIKTNDQEDVGCTHTRSVQIRDNRILFMGIEGIYAYPGGNEVLRVTEDIDPSFRKINQPTVTRRFYLQTSQADFSAWFQNLAGGMEATTDGKLQIIRTAGEQFPRVAILSERNLVSGSDFTIKVAQTFAITSREERIQQINASVYIRTLAGGGGGRLEVSDLVIRSTAAGTPTDTVLFNLLGFFGKSFSNAVAQVDIFDLTATFGGQGNTPLNPGTYAVGYTLRLQVVSGSVQMGQMISSSSTHSGAYYERPAGVWTQITTDDAIGIGFVPGLFVTDGTKTASSPVVNAGTVAKWLETARTISVPSSTTLSLRVRSSPTTFGPLDTSPAYVTLPDTGPPPFPAADKFFQVAVDLATTTPDATPLLDAIIFNWLETPTGILPTTQVASALFDNRYWLSVSEGTQLANQTVFVIDRHGAWTIFRNYPIGAMTRYKTGLLFGTSTATFVCWADQGAVQPVSKLTIKGLSSIPLGFFVTKALEFGGLHQDKALRRVYVAARGIQGVATGALSVAYEKDFGGFLAGWSVDLIKPTNNPFTATLNTAPGEIAKTFRFKIGNNLAGLGINNFVWEFTGLTVIVEKFNLRSPNTKTRIALTSPV